MPLAAIPAPPSSYSSVNPLMSSNKRRYWDLRGLTLVVVAVAWLAGILLNSVMLLPSVILLPAAGATLVGVILLWRNNWGRLILLAALLLLLGAWRYSSVTPVGDPQAISAFIGAGKIEVLGAVADEPKLQERSSLLEIAVSAISSNGGNSWQNAHGELEVEMPGALIDNPYGPNYGDNVELQGTLQAPSPHSLPNIFASMVFPRISVNNAGGNPIIAALYHLRTMLATIITQTLPQPEAALLIAILLGLRTPALEPLVQSFNVTGTAHLIVPSGFKVTILAGLIAASTRWLYAKHEKSAGPLLPAQKRKGTWQRWLSTCLVILFIAAYSILSGGGPAAIRAGIMGILLVLAPRLGRVYNIYTALALAALLMSLLDPFVLWDPGFQLSLLGTLGIVLLTPLFQRLLRPIARMPFGHYIAEIIAVTLAAQVATLPILALTFNSISLIAPLANILTVPLLGTLIVLGIFVCGTGLISIQPGIICGWVVWPLLWYVANIISWCATLPGAYLSIENLDSGLAWCYYTLLACIVMLALRRWPESNQQQMHASPPLFSQRTWRMMQLGAALLVILATAAVALAAQPNGQLTITFLNVGPMGQPAQGEAILLSTPDGKTALIDGGMDATSLSLALDSRLPFWQRSLDVVILTTPQSDDLEGLQDVVSRYQIGEVLDAGMLHPSTGYALWRRTISERNLHYVQLQQGATVAIGTQVTLQVLWPSRPLHKGSDEVRDNGLVVRLVAGGQSVLLLGAAALSKYALSGLLSDIDPRYLQANVVQFAGVVDKAFPSELSSVLQKAHPSFVVITPSTLSAAERKKGVTSTILPASQVFDSPSWQVLQTAQSGTLVMSSTQSGWNINTD